MSNSSLNPPNAGVVSDCMIGTVVARLTRPPSYLFDDHERYITASHHDQVAIDMTQSTPQQPATNVNQQSFSNGMGKDDSNKVWHDMTIAERALLLHRQRCTRTQRKYRKKINDNAMALADSVVQLQQEIQQLETRRTLCTPSHSLSKTSSWRMVVEYVHLFRHGYQPPTLITKPDDTTTVSSLDANHVQKRFLQAAMMPNVAFNGGRHGVDAVFEDWKAISQRHENTVTHLVSLENGAGGLLIARMDNVSTITSNMIRNCLLNLGKDDSDIKWLLIARKLLGQKLVIPTIVRYEWDELYSRFVSIYYEPDMLTPMIKLLGNLEDATTVVNSFLGSHFRL